MLNYFLYYRNEKFLHIVFHQNTFNRSIMTVEKGTVS